MEVNALRGIVKDGAGVTLYDYFGEFGLAQQSVDFVLGTGTTNVQAKVRDVLRKIETELKGTVSERQAVIGVRIEKGPQPLDHRQLFFLQVRHHFGDEVGCGTSGTPPSGRHRYHPRGSWRRSHAHASPAAR